MKLSSFLSLGLKDLVKGVIMAALGAIAALVSASINAGSLNFDWEVMGHTALLAAIAYLAKNFLTNSKNAFLAKEPILKP
jgi:membrane protein implicated in regulation of membrane protease activity